MASLQVSTFLAQLSQDFSLRSEAIGRHIAVIKY